jgi:hypothetical protein
MMTGNIVAQTKKARSIASDKAGTIKIDQSPDRDPCAVEKQSRKPARTMALLPFGSAQHRSP